MLLGAFLPKMGVNIGGEELTATVSNMALILGGLYALYRRYRRGDITVFGAKR